LELTLAAAMNASVVSLTLVTDTVAPMPTSPPAAVAVRMEGRSVAVAITNRP